MLSKLPFSSFISGRRKAANSLIGGGSALSLGAPKLRGISLTEALLALMLSGVALTQGYNGLISINNNLKVEATAGKIAQYDRAMSRFSRDNHSNLVAAAPAEYDIDVLEPYLAGKPSEDAFGNSYKISTRTYDVTVTDPATGGTKIQKVLQTLLIGDKPTGFTSQLDDNIVLRTKIANSAGANAGFISQDQATCRRPNGTLSPDGYICGAYGAYAINPDDFSASDFDDAALVSLSTVGDSATEDDQLYRYSYGDEDLNTMRTDLRMDSNAIKDVGALEFIGATPEISSESGTLHVETDLNLRNNNIGQVDTVTAQGLTLSGGTQNITTNSGNINISSAVNILARAQNIAQLDLGRNGGATSNRLELVQRDARMPVINGSAGALQIGLGRNYLQVGETDNFVSPSGNVANMGAGTLGANLVQTRTMLANEIRSVFTDSSEELAIQNVPQGTVTVGQKQAGLVSDAEGNQFEVADGRLIVGQVQAKNILCEECSTGTAFNNHAWYRAKSLGVYSGNNVYRNRTGDAMQIAAWSKQGSSGGWWVRMRPIGGTTWLEVHSDTNSGVSGAAPVLPNGYEANVQGMREAYILMPRNTQIQRISGTLYEFRISN